MSIQKVEMTVERIENGQYVEQVAYPFVEYEHVTMENGMDIMSMIRDDVSTPMVTHNTTSWKVGQGDSDVSETIVDSSIASMAIKGQTYQNILPEPSLRNSMTNGKTMQRLNEGYDSVNTVDGVCKSAILSGQTLVNIFPKLQNDNYIKDGSNDVIVEKNVFKVYHSTTANYSVKLKRETLSSKLKPNTDYTLIINIIESTITKTEAKLGISTHANLSCIDGTNYSGSSRIDLGNTIGLFKEKVRLKNELHPTRISDIYFCFWDGTGNDTEYVKFKVMLLEGDYTNVDIPYFTGIQSVRMPVLTTTGKNLYSGKNDFIKVNKGKEYNFYSNVTENATRLRFELFDKDKNLINDENSFVMRRVGLYGDVVLKGTTGAWAFGSDKKQVALKGTINAEYIKIREDSSEYDNLMIYESTEQIAPTTYESFKSNILSCNEDLELRGIGEVRDELDLLTGEVTERIGEIVLDGSEDESWAIYANNREKTVQFRIDMKSKAKGQSDCTKIISNHLPSVDIINNNDIEGVSIYSNGNIYISLLRTKATTLSDLKSYLQSNPLTIQYELKTPVIKTVDLKQHPFAYKDGYVVLTSSSEEISLTPTIEYSLIANRLGQIQSNQKLVEKQQAQIDELESMVIANLVNTQYQQALNEIKLGVK